jgi:hypothetical protein
MPSKKLLPVTRCRSWTGLIRLLHDEITKQEYDLETIREIAKQIKELYKRK